MCGCVMAGRLTTVWVRGLCGRGHYGGGVTFLCFSIMPNVCLHQMTQYNAGEPNKMRGCKTRSPLQGPQGEGQENSIGVVGGALNQRGQTVKALPGFCQHSRCLEDPNLRLANTD